MRSVKEAGVRIKGCSHITGGGFYENVPRMLKDGVCAVIEKDSYPIPPIFTLMAKKGEIAADVEKTMEAVKAAGETPYVIGRIEAGDKDVKLV